MQNKRTDKVFGEYDRPELLDLFCGAGGAARGYQNAGFYVRGIDIKPQPNYAGDEFIQMDVTELLELAGQPFGYAAVHASPPCQQFTRAKHLRNAQGKETSALDLVAPTRAALRRWGLPYVIENVPGAPLVDPVRVCGQSEEISLRVRRHRLFESNVPIVGTTCAHKRYPRPVGVYYVIGDDIPKGGKTAVSLEDGRDAMGIPWMTWNELKEAIPPSFTEYIGHQIMAAVFAAAA